MCLNHPWTTLSRWSVEALSSMKLVLGENRLGPAVKTAVTLPGQKGLLSFSKHSSLLFCEALSSLHHMEFYHGSDQKATPGHFPFSHSTSIGTAFIQKSNLKDLTSKIPRQLNSVQLLGRVQLFATPWIAARQASLFIINSRSSLRLMSIEVSDAIQPSHPLSAQGWGIFIPWCHSLCYHLKIWNECHILPKMWTWELEHQYPRAISTLKCLPKNYKRYLDYLVKSESKRVGKKRISVC